MDIVIQASQFLLSLSLLIVLHELGHFIPAKLFKTRVEKFYLFFDPWFSLFKLKKGETEYGIGWLPLGGYVKIAGMIDESMDKEQLKQEPQSWEFRSKPAWQRLIIMIGGVTINLFLGMLIYASIFFVWGEKTLPAENLTDGIWVVDSLGHDLGLENGDKIISLDNTKLGSINELIPNILIEGHKTIQVERNGTLINLPVPDDFDQSVLKKGATLIVFPRIPVIVGTFSENSPAEKAGIETKDKIIAVDGKPINYVDEFKSLIKKYENDTVVVSVIRNEEHINVTIPVSEEGIIGIYFAMPSSYSDLEKMGLYEFKTVKYGIAESIPAGITKGKETLTKYVKQLKLVFSEEGAKQLGGFISIGNLFPAEWNWQVFWEMTALLSIILAFMNILPIPALDGGHVMFLIYEVITGRKPNEKVMEYAQYAGMILLLALLLYANGNDIFKLFK